MTDIQELARMINTRDTEHDDALNAGMEAEDGIEKIHFEQLESRLYSGTCSLCEVVMTTRAQDLTDAAIQLAIVRSEIDPLRSPGNNVDPEELATQMEIALWSALTVILKVGQIDPKPFAITQRVRLDVDPFPPGGVS